MAEDEESPFQQKNPSFLVELFQFLRENNKWWLVPIAVVLLVIGGLLVLGATGAAPFIYTLF